MTFIIVLRCEPVCSDGLLQRCGETNVRSARKRYLLAISVSEARFEVSTGTFLMICSADTCAQRGFVACNFGGVSSSRSLDGGFLNSFAPQTYVQLGLSLLPPATTQVSPKLWFSGSNFWNPQRFQICAARPPQAVARAVVHVRVCTAPLSLQLGLTLRTVATTQVSHKVCFPSSKFWNPQR